MRTSQQGLTVIEILLAMAVFGIVMAGLLGFLLSSSKSYRAQNARVEMQADARAAMDFMVRELHLAFGTPTISTTVAANDTISFDRVEEAGYSTGGNTSSTLQDTRKTWPANAFAPSTTSAYTLRIIAGTGSDQSQQISDNTTTQLTLAGTWGTTPDDTSLYLITRNKGFSRTSASDHVLRYRIGATGAQQPLAEHVTAVSFAQPNAKTVSIAVTARTPYPDPNTGAYQEYTLSETVRQRN